MRNLIFLFWAVAGVSGVRPAVAQTCSTCPAIAFADTSVKVAISNTASSSLTPASTGLGLYRATISPAASGPLPDALPAGRYPVWCGARPQDAVLNGTYKATATPPIDAAVWNRINYVLNHKIGTVTDVQEAIWALLGTMPLATLNAEAHLNAVAMYNDAVAFGTSFTPAAGQRVGLVLRAPSTSYQNLIVELVNCASVGDQVWQDTNGNGVADAGEPALNGITVQLLDAAGAVLATAVTAPSPNDYPYLPAGTDGWYRFTGNCPGNYQVKIDTAQPALGGAQATTAATRGVNLGVAAAQSADFGFTAGPPPLHISCPQDWAQRGVTYSSKVRATGGIAPYAVTFTGALPPGLSMDSAGNVTGTLASTAPAGTYSFNVLVSASAASPATASCSLVVPTQLAMDCPLAAAQAGRPYNGSFGPSGGSGQYTAGVTTPDSFPPGLSIDRATGRVAGTPAAAGSFSFTGAVADRAGLAEGSRSKACGLSVEPAPPTVVCPSSSAQAGAAYSSAIVAAGGQAPHTFAVASGALPAGLSLNSATGSISGTPTAPGTFAFTAQVIDSRGSPAGTGTASCAIQATPAPLTLTCAATTAQAGVAYSSALAASGGTGPYTFSISQGALPPGLTLNVATGTISGVPTAAGGFSFTARVRDAAGNTAEVNCVITVDPPADSCGLSWGYWKNHEANWPAATLSLGAQAYTAGELRLLLGTAPKGDVSMSLAHQLIAAKFNVLNRTSSLTARGAIAAADLMLAQYPGKLGYNVGVASTAGVQMTLTSALLEFFNRDGAAQPGCVVRK